VRGGVTFWLGWVLGDLGFGWGICGDLLGLRLCRFGGDLGVGSLRFGGGFVLPSFFLRCGFVLSLLWIGFEGGDNIIRGELLYS
jgi:hypothetical protein